MIQKHQISHWELYVITDQELSGGRNHLEIARAAMAGGADVIQLRDKHTSGRKLYETGLQIRRLTRELEVTYIVNDRLDIALATDADGVHVGQDDIPAPVARQLIGPDKIVGVSVSTAEEALRGERDGADYLGVGPVFEARSSKNDAGEPRGLTLLNSVRRICQLPVIAIGGIQMQNIREVIRAGADGIAVISAVVSAENITAAARNLKEVVQIEKKNR